MAKSSLFSLLTTISFLLSRAWSTRPSIRSVASNVTCLSDYDWMKNAEQKDPCMVVAYVIAACAGDSWTQPALPPGYSYDSPNGTATTAPCYCSWSCYNLMMGCTLCQNLSYVDDIETWPSFSQDCPSNYKDEVFPPGYIISNNVSIPYWATIDPSTWPSESFDVIQANVYANQSHSDYYPSNLSSSSSSSSGGPNLGAIIGGTIGGAVGLLVVLVGLYFLFKRRKYRLLRNSNSTTPIVNVDAHQTSTHTRWPSDPSTIYQSTLSASPPLMSYETTQLGGNGLGTRVLSPTSYSFSLGSSPTPPTETASFFTTGNTVVQRTRAIPMV